MTTSAFSDPRVRRWAGVFTILAAIFWIYWPVRHGGFVWDDGWYITHNALIHDPDGLWKFWFRPGKWVEYYPLQETLLWFEWQLWGSNTLGYHLVSMALHAVNALLVWWLLRKLGLSLAWLGGLLFAVHPVQAESVAWICEQKNTLSMPFFLLAMGAWIDYDANRRRDDYTKAFAFYLAGMLCKITFAPFAFIILLYAWWKRGRISRQDLRDAVPFLALALVLAALTVWSGIAYLKAGHAKAMDPVLGGFLPRLVNAGTVFAAYFALSLLPVDLHPLYPRWIADPAALVWYLPLAVELAVLAVLWIKRRTWGRHVVLGLGFFTLILGPFLGFHGISYMKDSWISLHQLYLPLLGLITLVVAALGDLQRRVSPLVSRAGIVLVAVAVIALACGARTYAGWFVDEGSLWARILERYPNAWLPHYNLGGNLITQGNYAEAEKELRIAIGLLPDFDGGYYNLGLAVDKQGRHEEARALYRQALSLNPEDSKSYINLADSLLQDGKVDEAIACYRQALALTPELAAVHYDLGNVYLQKNDFPAAIAELTEAIRLEPGLAQAHENLGSALAQSGRLAEAIIQFQAALTLDPGYIVARNNLALALGQSGRIRESVAQFEEVLRRDPGNAMATQYLAKIHALQQQGRH